MVRERWYEMIASRGVVAIEDVGDDGPARRVRAGPGTRRERLAESCSASARARLATHGAPLVLTGTNGSMLDAFSSLLSSFAAAATTAEMTSGSTGGGKVVRSESRRQPRGLRGDFTADDVRTEFGIDQRVLGDDMTTAVALSFGMMVSGVPAMLELFARARRAPKWRALIPPRRRT